MKQLFLKKHSLFFVIMLVLTAAYVVFIWIHSTMSAEDSSIESANVLKLLNDFLVMIGLKGSLTDHIVRKSAHFCEFTLLGVLTMWTAYINNKRIIKNLLSVGFVCLSTAVVDEYIQLYSVGRSAEVGDVVLDFFGVCAGVMLFVIITSIIKLFKNRKGI